METSRGIVLNHIKYKETSIIVHIYTELWGRQGYIVNRVRSSKNKGLAVLLQPLTIIEMQVSHKSKVSLQRIKDFRVLHPLNTIPFDQTKRVIAFFLTEMMSKVLREEERNANLFNFIHRAIDVFDEGIGGAHNFHLFFLFQLSRFLGFYPGELKDVHFFDLLNGRFSELQPLHGSFLEGKSLALWKALYGLNITSLEGLKLSSENRNLLLDHLLTYYNLHIDGLGEVKSLNVIRQLFG